MTFRLSPANGVDLGRVIGLVEEAAAWLRAKGTDQWARPWPSRGERDERIRADILARKTWIAWDGDIAAATITVEDRPDEILRRDWDEARATYVHRLVVSRNYAGISLGAALLNWAGRRAAAEGAVWVRIDVWRRTRLCTSTTRIRDSGTSAPAAILITRREPSFKGPQRWYRKSTRIYWRKKRPHLTGARRVTVLRLVRQSRVITRRDQATGPLGTELSHPPG